MNASFAITWRRRKANAVVLHIAVSAKRIRQRFDVSLVDELSTGVPTCGNAAGKLSDLLGDGACEEQLLGCMRYGQMMTEVGVKFTRPGCPFPKNMQRSSLAASVNN